MEKTVYNLRWIANVNSDNSDPFLIQISYKWIMPIMAFWKGFYLGDSGKGDYHMDVFSGGSVN